MRILIKNDEEMALVEVDLCVLRNDGDGLKLYSYKYRPDGQGVINCYETDLNDLYERSIEEAATAMHIMLEQGWADLSHRPTQPGYSFGEGTEIMDDCSDIEDGSVVMS